MTRPKLAHRSVGIPQLSPYLQGKVAAISSQVNINAPVGPQGPKGETGATGATGAQGPKGDSGLAGAFYSVENYGAISPGAWATVACDPNDTANSEKYVAVSGGIEQGAQHDGWQDPDTTTDIQANGGGLSIASEFPGRHGPAPSGDPNGLTVLPNRLDGWIVKFAATGTQAPDLAVWALCVPIANLGGSSLPTVVNNDN